LLSEVVAGIISVSYFIGNAREMEVKRTFWHFTAENTRVNTLKNIAVWLLVSQKLAIHVCCILYPQNEFRPETSVAFTWYEAQEKNHTVSIDLSSRTPLGQLMWRAVSYTHQAGADGSTAPLPSRKKFSLFLGPPSYVQACDLLLWSLMLK